MELSFATLKPQFKCSVTYQSIWLINASEYLSLMGQCINSGQLITGSKLIRTRAKNKIKIATDC